MSYSHHHHHHGRVSVGRITVLVVCVLALGVNGFIFKQAAAPPHPIPTLEAITVASLIWMFAGAWGMCTRKGWGRVLMLTILYVGSFGLFLTSIITLSTESAPLAGRIASIVVGGAVYMISSLVLTHSRDVKRLTSRALE